MKRNSFKLILIFFIHSIFNYSQVKLNDIKSTDTINTKFYKNGQIKSFVLKKQFLTNRHGEKMTVFLDSTCKNTKQQKIIKNETIDLSNWDNLIEHYNDSITLFNRYYRYYRNPKLDNVKNDFSVKINSRDCPQVSITVSIDKDSLVKRVLISKNFANSYTTEKYYNDLYFKSISLEKHFDYIIENNNYLTVDFYRKSFIKEIKYQYISGEKIKIKLIKFYLNNKPKEYGHYYNTSGRTGIWYTYYENGRVSSEGEYFGSEFDSNGNEINIKKTGKWIYYTKQGCVEKEEVWDKGVLISPTPIIKKTKTKKNKKT